MPSGQCKRNAEWLKMLKSNAEWLKNVKKYTHYLNYENYSQSVLSKLIIAVLLLW